MAEGIPALFRFVRSLAMKGWTYAIMLRLEGFGAAFFAIHVVDRIWILNWPTGRTGILGPILAGDGDLMRDALFAFSMVLHAAAIHRACACRDGCRREAEIRSAIDFSTSGLPFSKPRGAGGKAADGLYC